jgi:hypothetical protein
MGREGGVIGSMGKMEARVAALMRASAKRIASHIEETLEDGIAIASWSK